MRLKFDTRIILVRHGQSTYNALGLYQGCCDESVLTEKGQQSAYATGALLRSHPIEAIYTSPLQRARQTTREIYAAIAASPLGTAPPVPLPEVHPGLTEIDLPAWQGLPFSYVRSQFREDYLCWRDYPHEFQMSAQPVSALLPVQATSATFPVRDLYRQAQQFWQEILPRHAGKTVLVVSHGGTIRALISTAIDLPCQHFHAFQQSNCGISILDFPAFDQPPQLTALNLTSHLGETLPKLKEGKQGIRFLLARSDTQPLHEFSEALRPLQLNFCVNADPLNARMLVPLLRRSHPKLSVLEGLPSSWHPAAVACWLGSAGDVLQTVAIFANAATLEGMLGQMLGQPQSSSHFPVSLRSITVVHYPAVSSQPILQALNWQPPGALPT